MKIMVLPLLIGVLLLVVGVFSSQQHQHYRESKSANCPFNSMCTCQWNTPNVIGKGLQQDHDDGDENGNGGGDSGTVVDAHYTYDVACLGIPLTKLPSLPQGRIGQMDIADSGLGAIHAEPLSASKIESLRLMNNNIRHIEDKAFSSMVNSLSSLDLAYNNFDAIPFNAFHELQNLQWLNLVGNQIRSLEGDWSFMQNTLTSLLVSENDITQLLGLEKEDQDATVTYIRDLQVLATLNIDGNKLTNIVEHSLPKTLQTLGLSNNLLKELPIKLLDTLPRLQWLDLRMNHIEQIPFYTFKPFKQMEKFDLGENNIKQIAKHLFNNTIQIRDFILDFNFLVEIPNDAFLGINCGRLILSYNHIQNIQPKGFAGIENSLEYLDLERNKLKKIPFEAFQRLNILKYLYLSSNHIENLPEGAFQSFKDSLRVLSLSGNQLTHIPTLVIQNCTKLSYLNLGYNQIIEINENDLTDWSKNLKTLVLRSNRLTYLDENVFNATRDLRELSLSFNPLNYMHINLFKNIGSTLETLEISFSLSEEQYPYDLLKPLVNLLWLSIDNNNIEILPKYAFDTMQNLQYVTLESNKIIDLYPNTFKSDVHKQLTDLRLSNNRLEVINSHTFQSLHSLQSIALDGNILKIIKTHAFNNLTNLVNLVLSNNYIKHIDHSSFTNLPQLQKLDIQNNYLFSFSIDTLINCTSESVPLRLNLSNNQLFETLPSKNIIHVQSIDLNYNNLQVPPKNMFEKLTESLRSLYLSFNRIESLELEAFGLLSKLEILTLNSNQIKSIKKFAFVGLDSLQILDLSNNSIVQLHMGQFSDLQQLRILNLESNRLRFLPKDIFRNTKLERLILNTNEFTTIPTSVLNDIGFSLRDLQISGNSIEHIDSTMFLSISNLLNLDLSKNRLNLLPDNIFTSLSHLQKLDLSSNPLRANYKELFHYAQSLKHLNLANIGMHVFPTLPLPNLIYLNVSSNLIDEIPKYAFKSLIKLRILNFKNNMLKSTPSQAWNHLPALKKLELSNNPIKEITSKCFYGLNELQNLQLDNLNYLTYFDPEALTHLKHLSSLTIRLTNKIPLKRIISNITSLQMLSLEVTEPHLSYEQLHGILTTRIKHLELWGTTLKTIDQNAFIDLENNAELLLKIRHTEIEEFPSGIISSFYRVPHLRLDFRHNRMQSLTPDVFYTNMTTWESLGTKLISGGILLSDNPWACDCRLIWLGHWLRRWLVESLQIHSMNPNNAQNAREQIRRAYCTHFDTGIVTPIVDLRPEHMSCEASALSKTAQHTAHSMHYFKTLLTSLVFLIVINQYCILTHKLIH